MALPNPASFTNEQVAGQRLLTRQQLTFLQQYLRENPGQRDEPMAMLRDGSWEQWKPTKTA